MKCQMKMAETPNFGSKRSQFPSESLAETIQIKPNTIANIKTKITIRSPRRFARRAKTIHQITSSKSINPMMAKMIVTPEIYALAVACLAADD